MTSNNQPVYQTLVRIECGNRRSDCLIRVDAAAGPVLSSGLRPVDDDRRVDVGNRHRVRLLTGWCGQDLAPLGTYDCDGLSVSMVDGTYDQNDCEGATVTCQASTPASSIHSVEGRLLPLLHRFSHR